MTSDRETFDAKLAEGEAAIERILDGWLQGLRDRGVDPAAVEVAAIQCRARVKRRIAEIAALAEPAAGNG